MNFFKNNYKIIIGFIVGVILASSITVYAYNYLASDIKYTNNKTVADALNDLYNKSNRNRILIGTVSQSVTEMNIDCTQYEGWEKLTIENFAVIITGLYGNGTVNNSYYTADESAFSYDSNTGNLYIKNWHGTSGKTDLRYSANIYLYI